MRALEQSRTNDPVIVSSVPQEKTFLINALDDKCARIKLTPLGRLSVALSTVLALTGAVQSQNDS